ncbi:hypothetical protein E0485_12665 [Paenibacillus albiflavus]|uniref:DUF2281 domain-containing protein n=1 Tax=Paenibacillus albiflavus TaxID=2545760 RepID=A0A4R4ECX3_9BACL|nr:hypothetical protein [Paenibacillus albiflavus]TCZ76830.1 hypothetical protein E0485_12665 [Paenibacillus albiflavus]
MSVSKEDLVELVRQLPEDAQQSAFDYLQFLKSCHSRSNWDEIDKREPDNDSLSDEEIRQLNCDPEYFTGEEAKREFGLQVELP